jgi:hypothetical protein
MALKFALTAVITTRTLLRKERLDSPILHSSLRSSQVEL